MVGLMNDSQYAMKHWGSKNYENIFK